MPTVVNFNAYRSLSALDAAFGSRWLYIGRANPRLQLAASPLANPYRVFDRHKRGSTLPRYRRWLWQRIQAGDADVLTALRALREDSVLVCYCKPAPCHGDVVLAAAAWLRRQTPQLT